ncbi:MAG: PaaI family thioesterase [Desulfuromonadales bacterium]|nr:PaaI family thioesterase [Desulfuromonadales bacterium]MBN2791015.1 PaaI family thioesterase [Desulfuromonadales bacterium]
MNQLLKFFSKEDYFARHCGIELLDAGPGWAKAQMPIQDFHLNGAKTVHGGAIFSLADFTFAVAANSSGRLALAINATTQFISSARQGVLYATAEELSAKRQLGNYQVKITDDQRNLIAMFQGTAFRKDEVLFDH